MQRIIAITALALCLCAPASAQKDFAGSTDFTFYSGDLGDWADPAAKDTKTLLHISGAAARRMFDYLGARSESSECVSDGEHVRSRGDLSCTRDEKSAYSCDIGVNLNSGKSIPGSIC